jgi:hypothetical protein
MDCATGVVGVGDGVEEPLQVEKATVVTAAAIIDVAFKDIETPIKQICGRTKQKMTATSVM